VDSAVSLMLATSTALIVVWTGLKYLI
jgi:hypothetical protein